VSLINRSELNAEFFFNEVGGRTAQVAFFAPHQVSNPLFATFEPIAIVLEYKQQSSDKSSRLMNTQ